jgi:hypothetical protein
MDIYDVGTVQHYSMWLPCKTNHNCNIKMNKYCTVMQFIMCVVFDSIKNHELKNSTVNSVSLFMEKGESSELWGKINQHVSFLHWSLPGLVTLQNLFPTSDSWLRSKNPKRSVEINARDNEDETSVPDSDQ